MGGGRGSGVDWELGLTDANYEKKKERKIPKKKKADLQYSKNLHVLFM